MFRITFVDQTTNNEEGYTKSRVPIWLGQTIFHVLSTRIIKADGIHATLQMTVESTRSICLRRRWFTVTDVGVTSE